MDFQCSMVLDCCCGGNMEGSYELILRNLSLTVVHFFQNCCSEPQNSSMHNLTPLYFIVDLTSVSVLSSSKVK